MGTGSFPGRWPPIPSNVEVKERVELYLYSPSGSSWLYFCLYLYKAYRSRRSVFSIATLLRSGQSWVCVLVAVRYNSLHRNVQIETGPIQPPIPRVRGLFPGLTTHPSSAKVKNEWSYTSTHHIHLHGVDKEILPLYKTYQRSLLGHKERYVLFTNYVNFTMWHRLIW